MAYSAIALLCPCQRALSCPFPFPGFAAFCFCLLMVFCFLCVFRGFLFSVSQCCAALLNCWLVCLCYCLLLLLPQVMVALLAELQSVWLP